MTSEEFKSRFIKALPTVPEELNLRLDEFYQFPESVLSMHELRQTDKNFLLRVGLPRQAPPCLSFSSYPDLNYLPLGFFPIGSDGCGSNLCIELSSGNVVLLDHDFGMKRILINSSLSKFAECLCIYQESLRVEVMHGCFEAMCQVDSVLNNEGGWWQNEIANT